MSGPPHFNLLERVDLWMKHRENGERKYIKTKLMELLKVGRLVMSCDHDVIMMSHRYCYMLSQQNRMVYVDY